MPAEGEEVILRRNSRHLQNLRPDSGEHLNGRALARERRQGRARLSLEGRRRQGAAVHLAIGGEREGIEGHDHGRDHVVGQTDGRPGAQLFRRRQGRTSDIGDEPAVAGREIVRHHQGALDAGVSGERRLDLGRLDPEAADLQLMIGAADELEDATFQIAHHVAGAVEPLAGTLAPRMGHEALGGEGRPGVVAEGETVAAGIKLARKAGRHRPHAAVEDEDIRLGDRPADRHGGGVWRQPGRVVRRGEGGVFGRTVAVEQAARSAGSLDGADRPRIDDVTAADQATEAREDCWV